MNTEPRSISTGPRGAPPAAATTDALPTVRLMGMRLHALTEVQCVEHIMNRLTQGRGLMVMTPNLDHLRRACRDADFAALAEQADLRTADGMPLVWASRLRGTPLPERVAGSSLVSTLAAAAAAQGRSIYLLGGSPGAAEGAARALQQRYPGIVIAGTDCPDVGFERDPQALAGVRDKLVAAAPDVVYVALGSPKQEQLIGRLRNDLPRTCWLGVGMSLGFLSGQVTRAPRWVQRAGLEWVHRLAQEPGRLTRRYLVDGLPFAVLLFGWALSTRWSRRLGGEM